MTKPDDQSHTALRGRLHMTLKRLPLEQPSESIGITIPIPSWKVGIADPLFDLTLINTQPTKSTTTPPETPGE